MNAELDTTGMPPPEDDILTFREIVERIWGGRWLILLVPGFAVAAAIVYVLLGAVEVNNPVVYYVNLKNI